MAVALRVADLQRALHHGVVPQAEMHQHLLLAARRGVAAGLAAVERKVGRRLIVKATVATPSEVELLASRVAHRRGAALVQGLNRQRKKTVAEAVAATVRNEMTGSDARQLIGAAAGLNSRQAAALVNYAAELKQQGVPNLAQKTAQYQARLIRQRASTILGHEARYAENAGQEESWGHALSQGWLDASQERVWIADNQACEECQAMDGSTARIGEPFDGGYDTPQDIHVNCGCTEGLQ